MSVSSAETSTQTLDLDMLPRFYRNKPRNEELFGEAVGMPESGRGFAHMLMLYAPWHDQLARNSRKYSDQAMCVAAFARLVEQGTGIVRMPIDNRTPNISLSEFVQENPYFYITALKADEEGKDPRYVAKIEDVETVGFAYESREASMRLVVSDPEGNTGDFPDNTRQWRLAHLATSHMIHITHNFPYLNDGYR